MFERTVRSTVRRRYSAHPRNPRLWVGDHFSDLVNGLSSGVWSCIALMGSAQSGLDCPSNLPFDNSVTTAYTARACRDIQFRVKRPSGFASSHVRCANCIPVLAPQPSQTLSSKTGPAASFSISGSARVHCRGIRTPQDIIVSSYIVVCTSVVSADPAAARPWHSLCRSRRCCPQETNRAPCQSRVWSPLLGDKHGAGTQKPAQLPPTMPGRARVPGHMAGEAPV